MSQSPTGLEAQPEAVSDRESGLRRSLSSRQLSMIAIGGAIGTGLFLGSGFAIGFAGPCRARQLPHRSADHPAADGLPGGDDRRASHLRLLRRMGRVLHLAARRLSRPLRLLGRRRLRRSVRKSPPSPSTWASGFRPFPAGSGSFGFAAVLVAVNAATWASSARSSTRSPR